MSTLHMDLPPSILMEALTWGVAGCTEFMYGFSGYALGSRRFSLEPKVAEASWPGSQAERWRVSDVYHNADWKHGSQQSYLVRVSFLVNIDAVCNSEQCESQGSWHHWHACPLDKQSGKGPARLVNRSQYRMRFRSSRVLHTTGLPFRNS